MGVHSCCTSALRGAVHECGRLLGDSGRIIVARLPRLGALTLEIPMKFTDSLVVPAVLAALAAPGAALACSCGLADLSQHVAESADTMLVQIDVTKTKGMTMGWVATVLEVYDGCDVEVGDTVVFRSALGFSCEADLQVGLDFVVAATPTESIDHATMGVLEVFDVNLCGYSEPTSAVTDDEWDYLATLEPTC